jgi:hypothetical protein
MPNGKTHPETVILRWIDPNGRPSVKLEASEHGSALGLGGASDPTYGRTTKGRDRLVARALDLSRLD